MMAFTGCGSNNNSGSGTANPVPGLGPIGPNVAVTSCQVGQVWAAGYGCLNRYSCQEGYGWVAGANICVQGTIVNSQMIFGGTAANLTYYGQLQIVNQQIYLNLLRDSQKCSMDMWGNWVWGASDCTNWVGASYFVIQGFSSVGGTVNMRIGAGGSNWSTSNSTMELAQMGRVTPAGAGFMIVGTDYMGRDVGLRAEAASGNLSNGYGFSVTLYYQGVAFANATMNRY
jgi:hypothetical protein